MNHSEDGIPFDTSTCLLVLDLTPLCNDFAKGFIELERQSNMPMKYVGISEAKELDWQVGMLSQQIIEAYLQGSMTPPAGVTIPEKSPPKEHLDAEPEPPTFKKLVLTKVTFFCKTVQFWGFIIYIFVYYMYIYIMIYIMDMIDISIWIQNKKPWTT